MPTLTIDPSHSHVQFSIKHMGLATVRGHFSQFQGTIETAESGKLEKVHVEIEASSIDTNEEARDKHLRSADFFDVEKFPRLIFDNTEIKSHGANEYEVTGTLTMHGQTHPVTLNVEITDPVKDPWGGTRRAATITGKLNRTDWGLTWNSILELGGLLVGEDVKLDIEVEALVAQPAAV